MFSNKIYILSHIQRTKVKNFIVVVTLLNFSYSFVFHSPLSLFSMSFLYLLFCEEFSLGGSHIFGDSSFIFKESTL